MDESSNHFGLVDYLIFTITLMLSLFIGVYHAWRGAGNSTNEYLFGGKMMGTLPIALSLAASAVSSQAMVGVPTDVYLTGAMMFWWIISVAIGVPIAAYVYLPLFQDLGLVSINQYLELRFHRFVRRLFSGIITFGSLFYLSVVTYGPSLTLSQVTGLNLYVCATITFAVCTFYTTIGGMKAVVWSDAIQIGLMIISLAVLVVKGAVDVGIGNVWQRNLNSGRFEFFNFDSDPTTQKTVWSFVIGAGLFWAGGLGICQGIYQRFLAVPSRRHAQKALIINILPIGLFLALCCSAGLVAYSKYFDCDPIKGKLIAKADQIVPYFVMDTLGGTPGLSGLFVAGIFSAALSTLSTFMNGGALTILEDFVRPFFPNMTDEASTRVSKGISFGFGLISYLMVFLISNVKTVLETGLSINGAWIGMSFGVFSLGMLVPWANAIGSTVGIVVSYASVVVLAIYTQAAKANGQVFNHQMKPTSIENCANLNMTFEAYGASDKCQLKEEAFYLLRISFMWYTLIGMTIVFIVGTSVSFISGRQDPDHLDPKLVFPFLRRWVGRKRVTLGNHES